MILYDDYIKLSTSTHWSINNFYCKSREQKKPNQYELDKEEASHSAGNKLSVVAINRCYLCSVVCGKVLWFPQTRKVRFMLVSNVVLWTANGAAGLLIINKHPLLSYFIHQGHYTCTDSKMLHRCRSCMEYFPTS